MNSSIHIDNKGKDILTLGLGPTQGLSEKSLTLFFRNIRQAEVPFWALNPSHLLRVCFD